MTPCFLCAAPTGSLRSLTQLTAPPAGSHDAVPICADCQQAWSFSLHSLIRADLGDIQPLPHPEPTDPRRRNNRPATDP